MQRLRLNRLKITIKTEIEDFGTDIEFKNGLNVIRAENTSGKSSCLNSILYALGFEIIIQGKKGNQNLVPALKDLIDIDINTQRHVLESFVELEAENHLRQKITIKRFIKGEQNNKLVKVYDGFKLSDLESVGISNDYYLHDGGAATNPKGFHAFLGRFLDWETPEVPRYDGGLVKLYVECLMPLHFIEQKRGWANLQQTTPTIYGIRDPRKQALEYLLEIEASLNYRLKQKIEYDKNSLKNKWSLILEDVIQIANDLNCVTQDIPENPVTELSGKPDLLLKKEDEWVTLSTFISGLRDEVISEKSKMDEGVILSKDIEDQISDKEEHLFYFELTQKELRKELEKEKNELKKLNRRLESIEEEITDNIDAIKIQKYSLELDSQIAKDKCPTCLQEISQSLIDPSTTEVRSPMTIEDNIKYLKQQKIAINGIVIQSSKSVEVKKKLINKQDIELNKLRAEIRNIRSEVVRDKRIPSQIDLRNILEKENDIKFFEKEYENFDSKINALNNLSYEWKKVLTEESKIPKDLLTNNDKAVLRHLRDNTKQLLSNFGFKSTPIEGVDISYENYRPIAEGIELAADTSASDNIRLTWAFILALQELSQKLNLKHLGVSFFDEPGQQEIEDKDFKSFLRKASNFKSLNNQVIIATSKDQNDYFEMISDIECHTINFSPDSPFILKPQN